jgi:hypothetical protein
MVQVPSERMRHDGEWGWCVEYVDKSILCRIRVGHFVRKMDDKHFTVPVWKFLPINL